MQGLVLGIKKTKTKANLKVKNRQEKNKKQMIPQWKQIKFHANSRQIRKIPAIIQE